MKENIIIEKADNSIKEEILELYSTMLYGLAGWDEHYPSRETIDFDIDREALFAAKDENGKVVGVISIDYDLEVNKLSCWTLDINKSKEIARLCVSKDMQGKGIAGMLVNHAIEEIRKEGNLGVRLLVRPMHKTAIGLYSKFAFIEVGKCHLFEKDYLCMELKFA